MQRYISSLHSADEPQEGRNSCPLLLYRFLSCWCLETFFPWYQPCSLLSVIKIEVSHPGFPGCDNFSQPSRNGPRTEAILLWPVGLFQAGGPPAGLTLNAQFVCTFLVRTISDLSPIHRSSFLCCAIRNYALYVIVLPR